MKQINLLKYGFIRDAENDFSDDGTRFTCYKLGRLRISKAVSRGFAYIAGWIDSGILLYNEVRELPHHQLVDSSLNGVDICNLTEADLIKFHDDCVKYEEEYTKLENSIILPTEEEIFEALEVSRKAFAAQYADIINRCREHIEALLTNTMSYELEDFGRHLRYIKKWAEVDNRARAKQLIGTEEGRRVIVDKDKYSTFSYDQLLILLDLCEKERKISVK